MILFPLMATWMWLQLFAASPISCSGRSVEDTSDAHVPLLPPSQSR